jgi:hypothetical protein
MNEWALLVSACILLANGAPMIVARVRAGERAGLPWTVVGFTVAVITLVAATVPDRLSLQLGAALLPLVALELAALEVRAETP